MSLESILNTIDQSHLLQAVLSSPCTKAPDSVLKAIIRPLIIKNKKCYQVSDHYKQKVVHHNLSGDETKKLIEERLKHEFKQGVFFTIEADYHVLVSKTKKLTILKKAPSKTVSHETAHDRKKSFILEEGTPIPFLVELGVMDPQGKVKAKKYAKFRQINRFLEFIQDVLPCLKRKKRLNIVDFGCGKAYLTFALYHYLHVIEGLEVEVTGLDLNQDVINFCQALANRSGYQHLHFSVGDINQHQPAGKIDMVIALHACDTATDAALEKAVRWNAEVILSAPCCQHELYGQIKNTELRGLLEHGILKERLAALATDAARAQLLEILGYKTQLVEFVDAEHTPKNLLIRAIKYPKKKNPLALIEKYSAFKKALNILPSLEKRFQKELEEIKFNLCQTTHSTQSP